MNSSPLTPAEYDGEDEDQPLLPPRFGLPHPEHSRRGQCQGTHQKEPVEQGGKHGAQHLRRGGVEGGYGESVENSQGQADVE